MSYLVELRQAVAPLARGCFGLPCLVKQHGNFCRGYVTKEAASDSDPIPKPRKGSPNDVADRPPPPEATPVIEPGMNPADWDPKDPKFQKLTKQLVWAIESRPAPEVTGQVDVAEPSRHLPSDRHTDARSGNVYESDVQVNAGRVNVLHLKEIYTKRWEARSKGRALRTEELAKEYGVDPGLLEKRKSLLLELRIQRLADVDDGIERSLEGTNYPGLQTDTGPCFQFDKLMQWQGQECSTRVFQYTELPIIRQDRKGRTVGYSADEAFQLLRDEQEELA